MTFALLAAGFVAGLMAQRFRWVGASTPQLVNAFIINVALPAMILTKVPSLVLDRHALVPVAASWLVVLTTGSVLWVLAKLNDWPNTTLGALLMVVPLTNSAYLGLPLLNAFTSDTVVAYGAFYDQFGNFFALALYTPVVIALLSPDDQQRTRGISLVDIARKIITFTPFPVLLFSIVFLSADTLPDGVAFPLNLLAATMGPLAAFIVGVSLRFKVPRSLLGPLVSGLVLCLVVAPAVVWLSFGLAGLSAPAVKASVLQAAMPSMITAGLIGIAAGFSERLIVAMLSLSTLFSVVTLSGLLWAFGL